MKKLLAIALLLVSGVAQADGLRPSRWIPVGAAPANTYGWSTKISIDVNNVRELTYAVKVVFVKQVLTRGNATNVSTGTWSINCVTEEILGDIHPDWNPIFPDSAGYYAMKAACK